MKYLSRMKTRVATPADAPAIRHLLNHADRPAIHNWWWEEHLGQDAFLLALAGKRLVGALLAWPDAGPVAWVRLAVLARSVDVGPWLDRCLPPLVAALRPLGARRLGWTDTGGWAGTALQTRGFQQRTRLATLTKTDRKLPSISIPGVRIRDGQPEDIEAVVRVDRAAFPPPWWLSVQTLERIREKSACFLVAEQAGRCVGYVEARMTKRSAHIGRLAVAPRFQQQGIGSLLLAEALALLWQQGTEQVTLNTQKHNRASQRLYLQAGFHPSGERINVWEREL